MNCNLSILAKGLTIIFLFFLFFIGMHIITNIIKSKDSICDFEKQSKFILECLNSNEKKTSIVRANSNTLIL